MPSWQWQVSKCGTYIIKPLSTTEASLKTQYAESVLSGRDGVCILSRDDVMQTSERGETGLFIVAAKPLMIQFIQDLQLFNISLVLLIQHRLVLFFLALPNLHFTHTAPQVRLWQEDWTKLSQRLRGFASCIPPDHLFPPTVPELPPPQTGVLAVLYWISSWGNSILPCLKISKYTTHMQEIRFTCVSQVFSLCCFVCNFNANLASEGNGYTLNSPHVRWGMKWEIRGGEVETRSWKKNNKFRRALFRGKEMIFKEEWQSCFQHFGLIGISSYTELNWQTMRATQGLKYTRDGRQTNERQ